MDEKEKEKYKIFVGAWAKVGPILEKERKEELKNVDVERCIAALSDCFDHALKTQKHTEYTGLIDLQKYFKKLRPC